MSLFQNVTLKLVAARLLPTSRILKASRTKGTRLTRATGVAAQVDLCAGIYFSGERSQLHHKPHVLLPGKGKRFHLFVSDYNPGAASFVRELEAYLSSKLGKDGGAGAGSSSKGLLATSKAELEAYLSGRLGKDRGAGAAGAGGSSKELLATSKVECLLECEYMLLMLNAKTWRSDSQIAAHVARAMVEKVPLLLVHEAPGLDSFNERFACEFSDLFRIDSTPAVLVRADIYRTVAVALKPGPWRPISLTTAAEKFERPPPHPMAQSKRMLIELQELIRELESQKVGARDMRGTANGDDAAGSPADAFTKPGGEDSFTKLAASNRQSVASNSGLATDSFMLDVLGRSSVRNFFAGGGAGGAEASSTSDGRLDTTKSMVPTSELSIVDGTTAKASAPYGELNA